MLILRVCTIYSSGVCIAASIVLLVVALIAPWWVPGPLAPQVGSQDGSTATAYATNSEITLWGNIGCGGNETMASICSMGYDAPAIRACLADWSAVTTSVEWQPSAPVATTTTPLPTLDPYRITTAPPVPPDWGCAHGGASCTHVALTTEDPNRWGQPATVPGEGQAYGDVRANMPEGSSVTAEKPPMSLVTQAPRGTTTLKALPTPAPIGTMPGAGAGPALPTDKPDYGFFGNIADGRFNAGTTTTEPLATAPDVNAKPKLATTEAPTFLPGVEQVVEFCPLARDDKAARIFVCQLHSQCDLMSQARNVVLTSVALAGGSGLLIFLFQHGGGGAAKDGKALRTREVVGFAAATVAAASALTAALALSMAAGIQLAHDLAGAGAVCGGLSIVTSAMGALFAVLASVLACKFPGGPPKHAVLTIKPGEFTIQTEEEARRSAAEEDFPGLAERTERTLAKRTVWVEPVMQAMEFANQVGHEGEHAIPFNLATMIEPPPPQPVVVDMPPQVVDDAVLAADDAGQAPRVFKAAEKNLAAFFLSGEGAVYAQSYYASLDRMARQQEAAAAAAAVAARPREVVPSLDELQDAGWETAHSPRSGEVYYFQRDTGSVQWEPPFLVTEHEDFAFTASPASATSSSWQPTSPQSAMGLSQMPISPSSRFSITLASTSSGPWLTASGSGSPTSTYQMPGSPTMKSVDLAGMTLREACAAGVFTPGSAKWELKRSKKTGQVMYVRSSNSEASTRAPSPSRRRGSPGAFASQP